MTADARFELTAVVLSPVHIGDGTVWTPDAYRLDGDQLVLFDPAAVVAGMTEGQRQAFLKAAGRPRAGEAELQAAQRVLREAARPEHERGRVAVSPSSRPEIEAGLSNPVRRGDIHPFIRTGGRPYLPGSAIKGAIRTALLNARAHENLPKWRDELKREEIRGGRSGRASTNLQKKLLGETDTDPFRFVRVADAALPEASTRVEWVRTIKRGGALKDSRQQMHFECLRPGTLFEVVLEVQAERAERASGRDRDGRKTPRRPVAAKELLAAVDAFYRGRWHAEMKRFFPNPWQAEPPRADEAGSPLLLRVGRFSHFESASLDDLRQGWQPQSRRPITEGSTRAVSDQGGCWMPFGWLALVPRGQEARLEGLTVSSSPARPRPASPTGRTPPRGLVGRRGTLDGDLVEVVAEDGDALSVRLLDTGDIETVTRDEVEWED